MVLTRGVLVALLSVPASLISVEDPKALRLGFDVQLIAIGCQVRIETVILFPVLYKSCCSDFELT